MRRSIVSIASNIAEGYGRRSKQEYIHYLYVAYGSCCELKTQLLLDSDLDYIKKETYEKIFELAREVEKMLKALIEYLDKNSLKPRNLC